LRLIEARKGRGPEPHPSLERASSFQPQARIVGAFLRPRECVALSFADRADLQAAGFAALT
jgi:hypothetical protein